VFSRSGPPPWKLIRGATRRNWHTESNNFFYALRFKRSQRLIPGDRRRTQAHSLMTRRRLTRGTEATRWHIRTAIAKSCGSDEKTNALTRTFPGQLNTKTLLRPCGLSSKRPAHSRRNVDLDALAAALILIVPELYCVYVCGVAQGIPL